MTVLVVGYGSMGQRRARDARAFGHAVAVRDSSDTRRTQAEADGFSLDETDPDVVLICTPAHDHADAIRRYDGRPLFVEKPLALAAADLSTRPHSRVTVGYSWRFHPGYHRLSVLASEGAVAAAAFWSRQDRSTWPGRAYADTLLEFSHEIDLALWLFGPARVAMAAQTEGGHAWTLHLSHESGVASTIALSGVSPTYDRGVTLIGNETVSLVWDQPSGGWAPWVIECGGHGVGQHLAVEDVYRAETEAFLSGRSSPAATLADGLAVLQICDEARKLTC